MASTNPSNGCIKRAGRFISLKQKLNASIFNKTLPPSVFIYFRFFLDLNETLLKKIGEKLLNEYDGEIMFCHKHKLLSSKNRTGTDL